MWHKVMKKDDWLFRYMKNYLYYLIDLKKTPSFDREILDYIKTNLTFNDNYDLNYYINYINNKRFN